MVSSQTALDTHLDAKLHTIENVNLGFLHLRTQTFAKISGYSFVDIQCVGTYLASYSGFELGDTPPVPS